MYTGEDKCVSGYASGLNLTAMKLPEETLFPQLLEGGLQLSLGSSAATTFATRDDAAFALVSNSDDNDESWTAPSALSWESASGEAMDGVIWNVSAVSSDLIVWTVFPSTGLLRSGERQVRVYVLFSSCAESGLDVCRLRSCAIFYPTRRGVPAFPCIS